MAEKVGFEPTDGVNRQTISSRSRYDRFDTSPDVFQQLTNFKDLNKKIEQCTKALLYFSVPRLSLMCIGTTNRTTISI